VKNRLVGLVGAAALVGTAAVAQQNARVPEGWGLTVNGDGQQVEVGVSSSLLPPNQPYHYGTTGWIVYAVSPFELQPYDNGLPYSIHSDQYIKANAADPFRRFKAVAHLPTGAHITDIVALVYDAHATGEVQVRLTRTSCNGLSPCTNPDIALLTSSGSSNYHILWGFLPVTVWRNIDVVEQTVNSLVVDVWFTLATDALRMGPILIYYKRQVSPAPTTATFSDVPVGHQFFQHIEALAASGITSGCGGGNYCPDSPVTRGQIASFLARALGLYWPDVP